MARPLTITMTARSDRGLRREGNEDAFCTDPELGLCVVCDGMGGHRAGEIASTLAVETIRRDLADAATAPPGPGDQEYDASCTDAANRLAHAIRQANQVVLDRARTDAATRGMGTTVVAALISAEVASIAHVGDSRLYLLREGRLHQLTQDHSVVGEPRGSGDAAAKETAQAPPRHFLTRAVGLEPRVAVDLTETPLLPGDSLLLCSDGLTHDLSTQEICDTLTSAPDRQTAVDRLIDKTNAAGGRDNTTVILVTVERSSQPTLWDHLRHRLFGT